jgi:hypothetical protein
MSSTPDRHRALAVAAGLLVRHRACPYPVRIEIVTRVVEQRFCLGAHDARNETLA